MNKNETSMGSQQAYSPDIILGGDFPFVLLPKIPLYATLFESIEAIKESPPASFKAIHANCC